MFPKKLNSELSKSLKTNTFTLFKPLPPGIELFHTIKKPSKNLSLLEHLDLSGAPESMLEGTVQLVVAAGAYRSMDVLNARRHPTEQALSHHVRVFYSGGTGDHRADNAILEHIAFSLQSSASTPICLVTKDGDFARQAGAKGGTIMDPEEFATLLEITAD